MRSLVFVEWLKRLLLWVRHGGFGVIVGFRAVGTDLRSESTLERVYVLRSTRPEHTRNVPIEERTT